MKVRLIAILPPVFCLVLVAVSYSAQSTDNFSNIDVALQAIRNSFGLSTGFERAVGDSNVSVALDLSRNEPRIVLDALVAQRPAYMWSLEGSVYCVYPRIRDESLSQLIVANYVLRDKTLKEATEEVFRLPEVMKWRLDHRVTRLIADSYLMAPRGSPQSEPKRITLTLSNVPLRTILSQVAYSFGKTRWTISHLAGSQEAISLNFN